MTALQRGFRFVEQQSTGGSVRERMNALNHLIPPLATPTSPALCGREPSNGPWHVLGKRTGRTCEYCARLLFALDRENTKAQARAGTNGEGCG